MITSYIVYKNNLIEIRYLETFTVVCKKKARKGSFTSIPGKERPMLKKIVSIQNVGRFKNSGASGETQFKKFTFVHGANGHGKTTLCTILRSVMSGDADYVFGRAMLGAVKPPEIQLLTDANVSVRFDGKAWSSTYPQLAIFDSIFVCENVHVGDVVDTDQKRGLYRVIVGDAGIALADQEAGLVSKIRAKTSEINAAEKAVKSHVPQGMAFETFLHLNEIKEVDALIAEQESRLKTVSEAAAIRSRALLREVNAPLLPVALESTLAATVEHVAEGAERSVSEHLQAHQMQRSGRAWVTEGLQYLDQDCPFCGQDIRAVPLLAAYKAVFGESYNALKTTIGQIKSEIDRTFGELAAAQFETLAEQHQGSVIFWSQYVPADLPGFPSAIAPEIRNVHAALIRFLETKVSAPLEPIALDAEATVAISQYLQQREKIAVFNTAIVAANRLIDAKKVEAGDGNTASVKAEIERLKAAKVRYSPKVAQLCKELYIAYEEKILIEAEKTTVRGQLDTHTKTVVRPYEERINQLLDDFNAGFSISQTQHSYAGGVATSSYQIVINNKKVDVGNAGTSTRFPSFRNTLSAGDRSTLALAFFIAHLERSPTVAQATVVFDDPFNSQDAFRRNQTMHEIVKLGRKCAQVIVLSHDATFLKQVWAKCEPANRSSVGIIDHGEQGSKILAFDLEKACQGRTANDIDDLLTYYHDRAGQPVDIVRKMRVVLETHLRTHYPAYFSEGEWLGDMIGKIRAGGDTHPAAHLYDKLNEINDSAPYHHGEDLSDITPDAIDPQELTGLVKRTLRIVNALQA
jgi:wobble nucleotide-excising tRNase